MRTDVYETTIYRDIAGVEDAEICIWMETDTEGYLYSWGCYCLEAKISEADLRAICKPELSFKKHVWELCEDTPEYDREITYC